jgi:biopolymer transport protein ExbB/biopolymer transport protein TolQ
MLDQVLIPILMRAGGLMVALTMAVLVLFSVYSLAVIGERWWTFRRSRLDSAGLVPRVLVSLERGNLREALDLCERGKGGHVGSVLAAGLREFLPLASTNPGLHAAPGLDRVTAAAREAIQRVTAAEIGRLERHLTALATLGNVSPFVGLFGTVIGVMRAFQAISRTGSGGLGTVSAGIAEALVATAAGLFVAIPAVTAYNHFVSRVKECATEMDGAGSELLAWAQRVPGGGPAPTRSSV